MSTPQPASGLFAIEWDAGYGRYYWVGDPKVGWGYLEPERGDIFLAKTYATSEAANADLPQAQASRNTARIVSIPPK